MANLNPKYHLIDLKDMAEESLVSYANLELSKHVALPTESEGRKVLAQKVGGILSFYGARKVLSPKQRERVVEYLLTIEVL